MTYEKHKDIMRKHVTASEIQICGSHFLSNMQYVTIENSLNSANIWLKILIFQSKELIGEK